MIHAIVVENLPKFANTESTAIMPRKLTKPVSYNVVMQEINI